MDQDTDKTKVIFRKFSDGEVIALFPQLPGSIVLSTCLSYVHVGQHGAADCDIVQWTKPAIESDYKDLFDELQSIGYNLRVVKRFYWKDFYARWKVLDENAPEY